MGVTTKLLALYRVDQQLRGLKGRLGQAQAYLRKQDQFLTELETQKNALQTQIRQLEATEQNDEIEVKSIEERIAQLRDRMNNAQTSKEHSALLTEINTLKADKEQIEERALTTLNGLDELRAKSDQIESDFAERTKVRQVAVKDRDEKEAEIADRLKELEAERITVEADVPAQALARYQERLDLGFEDIMAAVEEQDRRNLEYTCGSCFTHLPIELVSTLLKRGDLTHCPTCEAILYMESQLREDITSAQEKKRKRSEAASKS